MMKALFCIIAALLVTFSAASASDPPFLPAVVQRRHPGGSLRTEGFYRFAQVTSAALAGSGETVMSTNSVEIIAWAVRTTRTGEIPPPLVEECIVLVSWADSESRNHWLVAHLKRLASSIGSLFRFWRKDAFPPLVAERCYGRQPTDAEIADFIRVTDFGLNASSTNALVLRIESYRSSAELVSVLGTEISREDRKRRKRAFNDIHGEYFPRNRNRDLRVTPELKP